MTNKENFDTAGKSGPVFRSMLLAVLMPCAGNAIAQSVVVTLPAPVVVVPVVVSDDYVYYPAYGVYFNSHRHQYHYMNGSAWITAPAPQGVSVDVLLASPSVHMNFHDSPANHHAEMLRQYPRTWRADGGRPDLKHDDHGHQDLKDGRQDTGPDGNRH